jgi:hypothetical protein
MTVEIVHIAYIVLGLGTVRRLLLPELSDPGLPKMNGIPTIRLTVFFGLVVCSTAILTPLEVIATRLAIQRNHAASGFNSVSQEVEGDAEETAEYAGAEEDVIGFVKCVLPSLEELTIWRSLGFGVKKILTLVWLTAPNAL